MKETDRSHIDVLLIEYVQGKNVIRENLGIRSIAAYLMARGVSVMIETFKNSEEMILQIIRRFNPRLVGFSMIFQSSLFKLDGLVRFLRENGVTAHFTMGGHFPSIDFKIALQTIQGLDTVVRGEGEETILELLQHLDDPAVWQSVKGLAFRLNGDVTISEPRPFIKDLDTLPFPLRKSEPSTHRGLGICSLMGSRGCYYNCSFCSIHAFY